MRFIFGLRDSAHIWQMASKAEAREAATREKRLVDEPSPLPAGIPTAAQLLSTKTILPDDFSPSYSTSCAIQMAQSYGIDNLCESFVLNSGQRRKRTAINSNVLPQAFRSLPVYMLEEGVFVCAPEACFYYECQVLPFEQAVMLGFEICGQFTLDPSIKGGIGKRAPLTTPTDLRKLASSLQGPRGAKAFKTVVPWVLAGSESPKESMVGICLELPKTYGGYHLCKPNMNASIALSKKARRVYPHAECRVDLLVPGTNLALEYDSAAEHSGDAARKKDARRQRALALEGIEVIPMAGDVTASTIQMDGVAQLVAVRLGKSLRCEVKDYAFKKAMLQERLTCRSDWTI